MDGPRDNERAINHLISFRAEEGVRDHLQCRVCLFSTKGKSGEVDHMTHDPTLHQAALVPIRLAPLVSAHIQTRYTKINRKFIPDEATDLQSLTLSTTPARPFSS